MHHRAAQPVAIFDAVARCLQPRTDQPGEDILLGKALRPDHDGIALSILRAQCPRTRSYAEQRDTQPAPHQPFAPLCKPALDQPQQRVGEQGQRGRRNASRQHERPVLGLQSGEDRVAQSRLPDSGRKRRRTDGPHGGGADARHHVRRGERCLDQPQPLPAGHPHTIGSLDDIGGHILARCHRIAQDREQCIEGERQQSREKAERRQALAKHRP